MTSRHVDYCLVGQGLAGSTLAWTLTQRGRSVLVIDQAEPVSASRIAAGLLTPVTGPKLAMTLFWEECRTRAETFYRRIEVLSDSELFLCAPAVHLFRSENEQTVFARRLQSPGFSRLVRPLSAHRIHPNWIAPWGGFEMPTAAQLSVARYLDITRQHLLEAGQFQAGRFNPSTDLELKRHQIRIPRWDCTAGMLIFCQGWPPTPTEWFERIQFRPAKGEILTLTLPHLEEQRPVHAGSWLARGGQGHYLLGSTFEWNQLNQIPTLQGRETLLDRLRQWYSGPVEVIGQQAAVRPTMRDFKPVLGRLPYSPQIGILNGLGTKGSLMAPWLAELLVDHLEQGTPLPMELDVQRWFR